MIAGVCFQIIQDGGEVGGGKIRLKHEVIIVKTGRWIHRDLLY